MALRSRGIGTGGGRRPSATAIALVLAALLGLAELPFAAFMADDLIQLGALEGLLPASPHGVLDLYTLSDGDPVRVRTAMNAGALPWFFGTRFKMAFFRPLSSGLLALDHAVFGLWPLGYRLHAALWFVLLVAGAALVLRRALPGPTGTLALFVFTLSGIHGSLFWNATRHVTIAGALATFALAAHLRWREERWQPGRFLAPLGFALALGASEAALAVLAYLFAYEGFGAAGSRRERLRAASPSLVLAAAYLTAYRLAGLGATGGGYLDPFRAPVTFLVELPERWLFLAGSLVAGGGADLWVLRPDRHAELALVGAGLVIALGLMLRALWPSASIGERRGARWLIAGGALSAIAFVGTPIGSRCLVLPMLGASAAIGFVLQRAWAERHAPEGLGKALTFGCAVLATVHLALAPVARLATPYVLRRELHDRLVAAMADAEIEPGALTGRRLVVLHAPDFIIGLHPFFFRTLYRMPMPLSWWTLSWASGRHLWKRTAPETLELETVGGEIEAPGLAAGETVELDGLRATVLARGERGPRRVEFRFERSLDDPSLYLMAWQDGRLRHVAAPALGQTAEL